MEAREIRVGSKVNLNGADVTVKTIEYNPVSEEYFISVFEDYRQIKVNYLSPIPITEELLLKAGAVKVMFVFNLGKDITWNNGVLKVGSIFVPCEYWHNLQNIFYSLTGSELTFKQ